MVQPLRGREQDALERDAKAMRGTSPVNERLVVPVRRACMVKCSETGEFGEAWLRDHGPSVWPAMPPQGRATFAHAGVRKAALQSFASTPASVSQRPKPSWIRPK